MMKFLMIMLENIKELTLQSHVDLTFSSKFSH